MKPNALPISDLPLYRRFSQKIETEILSSTGTARPNKFLRHVTIIDGGTINSHLEVSHKGATDSVMGFLNFPTHEFQKAVAVYEML